MVRFFNTFSGTHELTGYTLADLGWSDHFARQAEGHEGLTPARVSGVARDALTLLSAAGESRVTPKESTGTFAVGDWVVTDGLRTVHRLTPKGEIARRAAGSVADRQLIAANVDTLAIVHELQRRLQPGPDRAVFGRCPRRGVPAPGRDDKGGRGGRSRPVCARGAAAVAAGDGARARCAGGGRGRAPERMGWARTDVGPGRVVWGRQDDVAERADRLDRPDTGHPRGRREGAAHNDVAGLAADAGRGMADRHAGHAGVATDR